MTRLGFVHCSNISFTKTLIKNGFHIKNLIKKGLLGLLFTYLKIILLKYI